MCSLSEQFTKKKQNNYVKVKICLIFLKKYNHYYNTLVKLSRNLFFYNVIGLKDNFETKIKHIIFSFFYIDNIAKKRKAKKIIHSGYLMICLI